MHINYYFTCTPHNPVIYSITLLDLDICIVHLVDHPNGIHGCYVLVLPVLHVRIYNFHISYLYIFTLILICLHDA